MCGVVGGLSAFYPQFSEVHSPRAQHEFCIRIIAKMPTLAAMAYRTSKGVRGRARRPFFCRPNPIHNKTIVTYQLFIILHRSIQSPRAQACRSSTRATTSPSLPTSCT
jgi:hypothetical protein